MGEYSYLALAVMTYIGLYIIKVILVMVSAPMVIVELSTQLEEVRWSWFWFTLVMLITPIVVFFTIIPMLWAERWQFFNSYTDAQILADIREGVAMMKEEFDD